MKFGGWFTFITKKKNLYEGELSASVEVFEKYLPREVRKIVSGKLERTKQTKACLGSSLAHPCTRPSASLRLC